MPVRVCSGIVGVKGRFRGKSASCTSDFDYSNVCMRDLECGTILFSLLLSVNRLPFPARRKALRNSVE
jgi:hypothetical protein